MKTENKCGQHFHCKHILAQRDKLAAALKEALESNDHDHILGDNCGKSACWVMTARAALAKLEAK